MMTAPSEEIDEVEIVSLDYGHAKAPSIARMQRVQAAVSGARDDTAIVQQFQVSKSEVKLLGSIWNPESAEQVIAEEARGARGVIKQDQMKHENKEAKEDAQKAEVRKDAIATKALEAVQEIQAFSAAHIESIKAIAKAKTDRLAKDTAKAAKKSADEIAEINGIAEAKINDLEQDQRKAAASLDLVKQNTVATNAKINATNAAMKEQAEKIKAASATETAAILQMSQTAVAARLAAADKQAQEIKNDDDVTRKKRADLLKEIANVNHATTAAQQTINQLMSGAEQIRARTDENIVSIEAHAIATAQHKMKIAQKLASDKIAAAKVDEKTFESAAAIALVTATTQGNVAYDTILGAAEAQKSNQEKRVSLDQAKAASDLKAATDAVVSVIAAAQQEVKGTLTAAETAAQAAVPAAVADVRSRYDAAKTAAEQAAKEQSVKLNAAKAVETRTEDEEVPEIMSQATTRANALKSQKKKSERAAKTELAENKVKLLQTQELNSKTFVSTRNSNNELVYKKNEAELSVTVQEEIYAKAHEDEVKHNEQVQKADTVATNYAASTTEKNGKQAAIINEANQKSGAEINDASEQRTKSEVANKEREGEANSKAEGIINEAQMKSTKIINDATVSIESRTEATVAENTRQNAENKVKKDEWETEKRQKDETKNKNEAATAQEIVSLATGELERVVELTTKQRAKVVQDVQTIKQNSEEKGAKIQASADAESPQIIQKGNTDATKLRTRLLNDGRKNVDALVDAALMNMRNAAADAYSKINTAVSAVDFEAPVVTRL